MMNEAAKLYIVVPCFNETAVLEGTVTHLLGVIDGMITEKLVTGGSKVLCVDDGSSDGTWELIGKLHAAYPQRVAGLRLSGNRGHQNALLAGLMAAKDEADCTVSIDADLQDDTAVIPEFVREFQRGSDIVYGIRSDRSSDSFFKRFTAESFYRLMKMLGASVIFNHADYRLMSRRALEALAGYREVNLFLRGIIPIIGFRYSIVPYVRKAAARPTHYPFRKMLMLALDGITSFSVRPIRLISLIGFLAFLATIGIGVWYLIVKLYGFTVPGWTSIILLVLGLGGLQLLSIGLIGEYIGKIYLEAKARPRYFIAEKLEND
jgi:glycosyltransferase involved in cell wall biosynthesis